jgi:hypothetical protein
MIGGGVMSKTNSRHPSARREPPFTTKLMMIAAAILMVLLCPDPRATAGEDPLPEAWDIKHPHHPTPPLPPPETDVSLWEAVWLEDFDDGSLEGWSCCPFTEHDVIELVPDGDGWCLRAASLDDGHGCGFVVDSPDLEAEGLNQNVPYRIDFRVNVPEVCNVGTCILRTPGVTLVMDEVNPVSLVGRLGWTDVRQEFHRLGQIKLGQWNAVRIVFEPIQGDTTWTRFKVVLNGRRLGDGVAIRASWKGISLFHPPYELIGEAAPPDGSNGGGYWDDFAVYMRNDPPRSGGKIKIVPTVSPNPSNPSTTIRFDLSHESQVTVDVFAVDGRRVIQLWNGWKSAGPQSFTWDGRDASGSPVSSGVYYGRVSTMESAHVVRMTVLK